MALQVQENTADYTGMITAQEYEQYIRFDGTDQDLVMPILVESSIRAAEDYCNATFGLKTFTALFDNVLSGCNLYLPFAPIISVESVKRVSEDGIETSLVLGTDYYVKGLTRKYLVIISTGTITNGAYTLPSYKIDYTAGNATPANVNVKVKDAILGIMEESFENRGQSIVGESVNIIPQNSKVKLGPYRNSVL